MKRRRARVLVIKRAPVAREIVCEYLADLGFEAHGAADGAEGLARLAGGGYSLVVTDLAVPGLTGWEVGEAVRRRAPHLPVILISGRPLDETEEARGCGWTIVQQAFPLADLKAAVTRALASAEPPSRESAGECPQATLRAGQPERA